VNLFWDLTLHVSGNRRVLLIISRHSPSLSCSLFIAGPTGPILPRKRPAAVVKYDGAPLAGCHTPLLARCFTVPLYCPGAR
jgi:hypothetical protein